MLRNALRVARPVGGRIGVSARAFADAPAVAPGGRVPIDAHHPGITNPFLDAVTPVHPPRFPTNPPVKPFKGASRSRPDLPYIELPSFVGMVVRLWVLFFGATFIGIPILNDYVIAA
jgi:hypothetical protein